MIIDQGREIETDQIQINQDVKEKILVLILDLDQGREIETDQIQMNQDVKEKILVLILDQDQDQGQNMKKIKIHILVSSQYTLFK